MTKMKNSLENFNSRFEQLEEWVNKLEQNSWNYGVWGSETNKQTKKKNEENWTEPKRLLKHHQVDQHTC